MKLAIKKIITYLEVYDNAKDEDGSHQIHQVRQVLPVKSFTQGSNLVLSGCQKMEQSNDSSFEFYRAKKEV